jgi:hypothetical protein
MRLEQRLYKKDHVKVRLTYLSSIGSTGEVATLKQLQVSGPYTEDVCILVPASKAYSILEAYQVALNTLKTLKIVPGDASLSAFTFVPTDRSTLAYVIEEP